MKNSIFNLVKGFAFLSLLFFLPSCLDIVLFEAPDTAWNGQSINVKVRVKTDVPVEVSNASGASQGIKVIFILSLDPIYDRQDIVLKTESFNTTPSPYSHMDISTSLTIPNNTYAGKYYLLAIPFERLNNVEVLPAYNPWIYRYEANVSYRPIRITGLTNNGNDIQPSNVYVYSPKQIDKDIFRTPYSIDNSPIIRDNIRVTYSLENRGWGSAGGSQTYFYINKDNRWFLLGSMPASAMAGNGRLENTFERNIQAYGLTSGTATLYIFTDFNNQVAEARENNNIITKSIYIDASTQGNVANGAPSAENIVVPVDKERLNKALLAANLKGIDEESVGNTLLSGEKEAKNAALPLTLTLFPNPTTDKVTVSFYQEKEGDVSLQLFDTSGKMLHILPLPQLPVGQYQQEIPLHSLGKGTYIVKCQSGGKMSSQKLIVK